MDIKIGPFKLAQRTMYSKIQVFDQVGNILDNEISDKIICDYNRQKNNPEKYFDIDGEIINDYTDNKIDYLFIPDHIKEISDQAFINTSIKYIYFPDTITVIGSESFKGCKYLKEIILPSSLERLGNSAFEYCENLESVIFNSNILELSPYCFSSCVSLRNFTIPDSVMVINDGALSYCRDLKRINVPKNFMCFGNRPFAGSEIQILNFNHDLCEKKNSKYAYRRFLEDSEIKKIEIAKNVKTLDKNFFRYACGSIREIDYLGTKKEFKEFKKNNNIFLYFLKHAKVNIKDNINILTEDFEKERSVSNYIEIDNR